MSNERNMDISNWKISEKNMKKDKLALPQQQDLRIRVNYYLKVNIYMKKEL